MYIIKYIYIYIYIRENLLFYASFCFSRIWNLELGCRVRSQEVHAIVTGV